MQKMAHLFKFSEDLIVNLDHVEAIIMYKDHKEHDRKIGLSLLNQADEQVAHKPLDDPTTEETWNRLKQIAAQRQDTENQ